MTLLESGPFEMLLLGTEHEFPEKLHDWLSKEPIVNGTSIHRGMLNEHPFINDDQIVVLIAPHRTPAMRDNIHFLCDRAPIMMIGRSEERMFYPDVCTWINEEDITPSELRLGLKELFDCAQGRLLPLLHRQACMRKLRQRLESPLEQNNYYYLQLVSCRWRPVASGDSAELRQRTQYAFEKEMRTKAPLDSILGKLLDDQFIVVSRDVDTLNSSWMSSVKSDPLCFWTLFKSKPIQLKSYDELGAAVHSAVRHIERERTLQPGLSTRSASLQGNGIITDLIRALREKEFYLEFQPMFDTKTSHMVAAEALLRWQHPQLGIIPPSEFIQDVEMAGMIRTLGHWAMCESFVTWHRLFEKGICIKMSVNVSFPEVADPHYAEKVLDLMEEHKVPAEYLELELTETAMMLDASISLHNLLILKKAGIGIVLDDFGTGFSSLSHLSELPITGIKLDRSFVSPEDHAAGVGYDRWNARQQRSSQELIVESMLALAKQLGLETTAEGVEDQQGLEKMSSLGCDRIQGYFYARPLSVDDLINKALHEDPAGYDVSGQQCLF
ncbi:MAG: EAL domain-containing protein [Oleibacter sp.]|nr:EAL domain-containing protein [Thalassolituus sp.]